MYILLQFCALVLVLFEGVYSQQCSDCINYELCPEALKLMQNHITGSIQQFRKAYCGFDNTGEKKIIKVCCSMFSTSDNKEELPEISEDERIANHKNLELLAGECGVSNAKSFLGGQLANLYEFPWIALISHEVENGTIDFNCGGSIINKRYVLTSAHCVKNKKIAGVHVGEYNLHTDIDCRPGQYVCEEHIQDLRVEKSIIHEKYYVSPVNDIALLRLEGDIDFNHRNVHRICLPITSKLRQRSISNHTAIVTGWGLVENHNVSPILLKGEILIHADENCNELYSRLRRDSPLVTIGQLCAGSENKDSCFGDPGGPLMLEEEYNNVYRHVQYGIVSGHQKCERNFSRIYTDVTKFMGWILDNISP